MKTYRTNALMAGLLYLFGTVFGVMAAMTGGEVLSSIVTTAPLAGADLVNALAADPARLVGGAFFVLLMGISLAAMTVFLYPVFRRDSEVLALGMLLFRGALEGAWYFVTCLSILLLSLLGAGYAGTPADADILRPFVGILYQFQGLLGPVGTILFLVGATCLYVSFFRTRLIARWLSVWGLIGVVPYLAYALLHLFGMDDGIGFYLQMILAPQEMVMALWLIIRGFDQKAVARLMSAGVSEHDVAPHPTAA